MPRPLRQSTASQAVVLGPFLDSTDGNTQETALSIANTDIRLRKAGAAAGAKNSGGATHDAAGYYLTTLDATDTNTVGPLLISVHVAGALAVWLECYVYEEAVYDALFAASAPGYVANAPVNVAQISGDAGAADNAEAFFDGTGYAGTNNVIPTVTAVTNAVALPTIPSNWITAAGVAAAALNGKGDWLLSSGYTAPDNAGVAAIKAKTDNLPPDPADQSLVIAATDAIAARLGPPAGASIAADIATRLAAASYTAPPGAAAVASQVRAELATELGRIDAAVTTRQATFTASTSVTFPAGFDSLTITSGTVSADVKKVNAVTVTGTGTSGDPWGPA
ncbi:hypothetical protein J0H58_28925 [bacterium]|nr:hypothetical protein [bacterium]